MARKSAVQIRKTSVLKPPRSVLEARFSVQIVQISTDNSPICTAYFSALLSHFNTNQYRSTDRSKSMRIKKKIYIHRFMALIHRKRYIRRPIRKHLYCRTFPIQAGTPTRPHKRRPHDDHHHRPLLRRRRLNPRSPNRRNPHHHRRLERTHPCVKPSLNKPSPAQSTHAVGCAGNSPAPAPQESQTGS